MKESKTYKLSRIISIYVGLTLTGIILIFISVYNASRDLEIHHRINSLYTFGLEQLGANNNISGHKQENSGRKYVTLNAASPIELQIANTPYNIDQAFLDKTRLNNLGGYTRKDTSAIIWVLLPAQAGPGKMLLIDEYKSSDLEFLLLAYKKRLIIPAVFFIWLAVWGSLILKHLVTSIQAQKEAVEHMALHDALTGLGNRNLFTQKLEKTWQQSKLMQHPFTIAMVDLDNFKDVNDTHGHSIGDQLLQLVAKRIKRCLRNYDIAARLGGDEFLLLLPNTSMLNSKAVCERLHHELVQPYLVEDNYVTIGASIGIASYPDDAETLATLSNIADKAMYTAKNAGGGLHSHNENYNEQLRN